MDRQERNLYMNKYRNRLRLELISILGGKCCKCRSSENIEFDHIDPKTKKFTLGSNITRSRRSILSELKKCQLLCKDCHIGKTNSEERREPWNKGSWKHGSTGYHNHKCRCTVCKEWQKQSTRKYYEKRKTVL